MILFLPLFLKTSRQLSVTMKEFSFLRGEKEKVKRESKRKDLCSLFFRNSFTCITGRIKMEETWVKRKLSRKAKMLLPTH